MQQKPEFRDTETRILPYAAEKLGNGAYVVSSYFGGWAFLSEEELRELKSENFYENNELYGKLKDAGIIVDNSNMGGIVEKYRTLNRNLFLKPSLHMINVTNTCNYRCKYCHAGVSQGKDFMSMQTALKVIEFIFRSSGQHLTIEFQGGECLLNWKVVNLVIEKSRQINKVAKKDLNICIVSNLSLLNEEKLKFLVDNDVSICTSVDGPKEIHDANRNTLGGADTYEATQDKIRFIKQYYSKHGFKRRLDALATITRTALDSPRDIVDTYLELGIKIVHLRPVQNLGDALSRWPQLAYSPEEFYDFWAEAMDYIIELNKKGIEVMERGAHNILKKIMRYSDPLYVELMNPTGMGRSTLLYNHDGAIYSSDEGRMIPEPIFSIGTVDQEPFEVLGSQDNINTWISSFTDLTCYNSAYRPWAGIHPVHIYQEQGTIIPNINRYDLYKIYRMQCRYLFEKLAENGFEKELFAKWSREVIK